MGGVVEIFLMACFCVLGGYFAAYIPRIEKLLERIAAAVEGKSDPTQGSPLPAGLYGLGQADKNTGRVPLVPSVRSGVS